LLTWLRMSSSRKVGVTQRPRSPTVRYALSPTSSVRSGTERRGQIGGQRAPLPARCAKAGCASAPASNRLQLSNTAPSAQGRAVGSLFKKPTLIRHGRLRAASRAPMPAPYLKLARRRGRTGIYSRAKRDCKRTRGSVPALTPRNLQSRI